MLVGIIDSTLFVEDKMTMMPKKSFSWLHLPLSSSNNIDKDFYDGGMMCDWFIMVPI